MLFLTAYKKVTAEMVPIERWLSRADENIQQRHRPLVTLSYAQSLDGSIAAQRGIRTVLSSPESLHMTHYLRAAHAAILVGIETILADNPSLTVRLVEGKNPQPVILDSRLRFPLDSKMVLKNNLPWIAHSPPEQLEEAERRFFREKADALEANGVHLLSIPKDRRGRLSLPALLECLAGLGVSSLMVEGGSRVITSFLQGGLVDFVVLTIAPVFLGGLPGVELNGVIAGGDIGEKPSLFPIRLREPGSERLGDDLIVWGEVS